MAKHLDKFTRSFRQSRIPFLLAEVITDGHGDMVDLACRFANSAAGALLEIPVEELTGQRFTRRFPSQRLSGLTPLQDVAFSGSAASFSYTSVLGRALEVTCYQAMYGVVGCILEPRADAGRNPGELLAENLPGGVAVLELSRAGLRCLSFNRRLCTLSGWERKELLDRFARDFSSLVEPADWPDLLQNLLDAARDSRPVAHELRLLRRDGSPLWIDLRAELLSFREGISTFYAVLLDIDQRRRTQFRLRETLGQLETAQDQLSALFDNLPGSYCLLRRELNNTVVPLRASRGLVSLLGCSAPELLRRLASDPLWPILPDDRDGLAAAARAAWGGGQPLRHPCRLRREGNSPSWITLEGACQPQTDGTSLLYIACTPLDREKAAETELAFRSHLCELLLDRSAVILFNYDPAEDTAHIEYFDRAGRRTQRTAGAYLSSLGRLAAVHPADQKRLLSAVKRAVTQPAAELVEFRGDYDGTGWRWYQVTWLRSIDSAGNVTRLLGKGVDITAQKAAAQRFQQLKARQRKLPSGALASARLDLTADRILDAKGSSRHLSRVLFGNTADACLRHLRDSVPGAELRQRFDELFRRDALLEAFRRGETHTSLEHSFSPGSGGTVWARTELELAAAPEDGHVTAFCTVWDTEAIRPDPVLEGLARRYDYVLTMDASGGACRSYGNPLPPGSTYRALAARYVRDHVSSSHQRSAIRQAVRLDTVLDHLADREPYEFTCTVDAAGGPRNKRLCCSWLDQEAGILLVTIGSV